jgi:hypothetical protein
MSFKKFVTAAWRVHQPHNHLRVYTHTHRHTHHAHRHKYAIGVGDKKKTWQHIMPIGEAAL